MIEISDGASNIINTIQTILVTFFITLNFNEGYILYNLKKKWVIEKENFILIYLQISALLIPCLNFEQIFFLNIDHFIKKYLKLIKLSSGDFEEIQAQSDNLEDEFLKINKRLHLYVIVYKALKQYANKCTIDYKKLNHFKRQLSLMEKKFDSNICIRNKTLH